MTTLDGSAATEIETRVISSQARVGAALQSAFDQAWAAVFGPGTVRTALFTAANRHEGVSSLAAGVALTGARVRPDAKIALVDLNLRYPKLASILDAPDGPGVAELLSDSAMQPEAVAQAIGSPNLMLYPAGKVGAEASGLLSGDRLRGLLARLSEKHDFVLCDCAAVNFYPDAMLLVPMFNGVVLVTEAGATRRESLMLARKRLDAAGGKLLGVILNKRRYPVPKFLYRRS